jgi:hypothetical protein
MLEQTEHFWGDTEICVGLRHGGVSRRAIRVRCSIRAFGRAIVKIDISALYPDLAVHRGHIETDTKVGKARLDAGQQ